MGQDDIFKLLLIILLLINERECCEEPSSSTAGFCNINEVIITVLLLNAMSGNFFSTSESTQTLPTNTTF